MQENNHSEFDNLYRKAASDFPLQTDSANWNSVLEKLEEDDKKKPFWFSKKVSLLTLLLLMLLSSTTVYVLVGINKKTSNNIVATTAENANETVNKENNEASSSLLHNKIKEEKQIVEKKEKGGIVATPNNFVATAQNSNLVTSKKSTPTRQVQMSEKETKLMSLHQYSPQITNQENISKSTTTTQLHKANTDLSKKTHNSFDDYYLTSNINNKQNQNTVKTNLEIDSLKKSFVNNNDSNNVLREIKDSTKKSDNKKISKTKEFYVGALYAFDNTSEKNERHSNEKGENFGISLLLGYKILPKISIETGIAYQNKEYYTSGNYFNKSILGASGTVYGIEAENSLFEIPISIKFDLLQKNKHCIFSTIGSSSYFLTKEKYEYEQEIGGIYTRDEVEFSTITTSLFATFNISVGYQLNLKKLGSIRLQPYLNLPLKGIGKSQEQIVSKGFNIGWIYKL